MSRNKIMVIGEFLDQDDINKGEPFMGSSGWILKGCMRQIGIAFEECYVTNVFNLPPPGGRSDIGGFLGKKIEAITGTPPLGQAKYVRAQWRSEIERLYDEIEKEQPNVILALGPAASWGVLGTAGLKAVRGAPAQASSILSGRNFSRPFKVIASYHPTQVRKDWSLRPILLSDLDKTRRQAESPAINRPRRNIWIKPALDDLRRFDELHIAGSERVSIDIETKGDQLACIGVAPSTSEALVIPFLSQMANDGNYWPTIEEELEAWSWVRKWCMNEKSVFQNGLFDMHYLWKLYGIPCFGMRDDTMLLHHALQPEMQKGLGFLATLYTDEASWKFMRNTDNLKKED